MEKLKLKVASGSSEIKIGYGILDEFFKSIDFKKCFFVIDNFIYDNFFTNYFNSVNHKLNERNTYFINSVEENKNMDTAIEIIKKLSFENYLRDSLVIGIGGGIVGDIVGFVSSIYMRGIDFINVPTTLLAQVDSSIGGKNALNSCDVKNLVGTFKQPKEIIIDIKFLETITKRELISGLAEVIKYGIVFECEFLNYVEKNLKNIFAYDFKILQNIIRKSCEFKISVVEKDECDVSIRKILNFGHTIGHAIESSTDYKIYTHGESVLIGMFFETCMAFELNLISENYFNYICNIIKSFGLTFDSKLFLNDSFYLALLRDKKNKNDKISFILPSGESEVCNREFCLDEIMKFDFSRYYF